MQPDWSEFFFTAPLFFVFFLFLLLPFLATLAEEHKWIFLGMIPFRGPETSFPPASHRVHFPSIDLLRRHEGALFSADHRLFSSVLGVLGAFLLEKFFFFFSPLGIAE